MHNIKMVACLCFVVSVRYSFICLFTSQLNEVAIEDFNVSYCVHLQCIS